MINITLYQSFLVKYINFGLYNKINNNREKMNEIIKEDMKKIEKNISFETIVKERLKQKICHPPPKKMPCGAISTDINHSSVLNCEYCEHKFNEASVPGFC